MLHEFALLGRRFVVDVHSASVHEVDALAAEVIRAWPESERGALEKTLCARHPEIAPQEISDCLRDVEALAAAGKLFSPPLVGRPEDCHGCLGAAEPAGEPVVKALCLHVAHSCNFRCAYCFAGEGKYHGADALMPLSVGQRAIDFLLEHSGSRHNLEVDFFGGEPLLNWEVVRGIVTYARRRETETGKHFRFTFTTNGLQLTPEIGDFLNAEMDNVVLSLDGRPEVHDRLRRTPTGEGTYALVVPKFQDFVRTRGEKSYYIRGTFTHYNTDFCADLLHMADLGFAHLSMEPVVAAPTDPWALTAEDLPRVLAEYEKLARVMDERAQQGRGFTFYHYQMDLEHAPCLAKREKGCGSGTEYLAVTPTGELYPCHQFVGEPAFCLGDLARGITRPELVAAFAKNPLTENPACRDCWAQLYCAGGCAANAYHATGDLLGVYDYGCQLFRKRLECALWLHAAETDRRQAWA